MPAISSGVGIESYRLGEEDTNKGTIFETPYQPSSIDAAEILLSPKMVIIPDLRWAMAVHDFSRHQKLSIAFTLLNPFPLRQYFLWDVQDQNGVSCCSLVDVEWTASQADASLSMGIRMVSLVPWPGPLVWSTTSLKIQGTAILIRHPGQSPYLGELLFKFLPAIACVMAIVQLAIDAVS